MSWTVRYKAAHHEWCKRTAPDYFNAAGGNTMRVTYPKVTSSNGLRRAIINFMGWEGHHLEATNTMGRPIDKRETYTDIIGRTRIIGSLEWQKGSGRVGSSDAKGHINHANHKYGIPLYVEIKYGKDTLKNEQIKYGEDITKTKGVYVVIKNIDQWFAFYDEFLLSL
jgi:hypothetical protein